MDVSPLIGAASWGEDRILLGMGVPPELVRPGGTGSGYSGRSIPREAFLEAQQKIADAMLQNFVEQVVRPLVLWNYGDIPFNVQVKPLIKTQADDTQGEQGMGQAPPPEPMGGAEPEGGEEDMGALGELMPGAMSLENDPVWQEDYNPENIDQWSEPVELSLNSKVLTVVNKVLCS